MTELQCLTPHGGANYVEQAVAEALGKSYQSVAVPPWWVKKVRRDLNGHAMALCSTVGHPWGNQRTEVKVREAEVAMKDGAAELEVMLNLMALRDRQAGWVKPELAKLSQLLHSRDVFMTVTLNKEIMTDAEIGLSLDLCAATGIDRLNTYHPFVKATQIEAWLALVLKRTGEAFDLKIKLSEELHREAPSLLTASGATVICVDYAPDTTNDW